MGSAQNEAECFEALLALLRARAKWTSDDSAESNVYLRQRKTRGETSAAATTTNPPRAKKSERRRGRIFSIWADGNLRLLHIGLCATEVLCNSRARLYSLSFSLPSASLSSSSFPFFYYFFFFFFSLFRISSRSHFDVYKCAYACASRPSLSFSLHFLFLVPSSFFPSLCMMRPTRVYLTPRATNEESSRAQATSRTWSSSFYPPSLVLATRANE